MSGGSFFEALRSRKQIRPHRFGGEGVLIGGANSYTKCLITFVYIAVAMSALAGGGPKQDFAPRPRIGGVCVFFSTIFGCLSLRGY